MRYSDCSAKLEGAGVAVEELGLGVGVEQGVVLVLAVQSDQAAPQLTQLTRVGASTVDSSGAPLAELSLKHQGRPARLEPALDCRSVGSMPDLVRSASRPQRQPQGVHDQRLAASGLAREQVETRAKSNAGVSDQGQVADPELRQHYFIGTRGRPQPSFSPSRL